MSERTRLTALGVWLAGGALTTLTAAADLALSPGLGTPFLLLFAVGCGWVSVRAGRAALFAAATLPPLAYLAATVLAVLVGRGVPAGGTTMTQMWHTLGAGFTALLAATTLGTGLAVLRGATAGGGRHLLAHLAAGSRQV